MYSQAPLKHRKLLITFVIIGPRVDRGASINQGVSPRGRCFSSPRKRLKRPMVSVSRGEGWEGEEGKEAEKRDAIGCLK